MISELVTEFIEFFALVVWGGIIIGGGVFIANLVANTLKAGGRSQTVISVTRLVIIVLGVAIGLRAMGFANDMILLLFGLLWGAVSLAAALAFGLGGRQVAGELLERWTKAHVPGIEKKKPKRERHIALSERALHDMKRFIERSLTERTEIDF